MTERLLEHLDRYFDAVPRTAARAEHIGPFTLFVREAPGWPYYARPTPGISEELTASAVDRVRERQRELGMPESFEWIVDLTPTMATAAEEAGMSVVLHPLLHLKSPAHAPLPEGFTVRFATAADDMAPVMAVAKVGFDHPGTAVGDAGSEAVRAAAEVSATDQVEMLRKRIEAGLTVTALVLGPQGSPVAVGSHQPVGGTSEIVGVATLPAFRRRGLGAAVTAALAADAIRRGCETVCLFAGDEDVARVYEQVGFVRVGTSGAADPPEQPAPRG
jgi:GNAT superfamily N-acetyltransferase